MVRRREAAGGGRTDAATHPARPGHRPVGRSRPARRAALGAQEIPRAGRRRRPRGRLLTPSPRNQVDGSRWVSGGEVTHAADKLIPVWYHCPMAMTLRLTDEDEHALALLAEAQGISKQEAT